MNRSYEKTLKRRRVKDVRKSCQINGVHRSPDKIKNTSPNKTDQKSQRSAAALNCLKTKLPGSFWSNYDLVEQKRRFLPQTMLLNVKSVKMHYNDEYSLFACRFCPDKNRNNIVAMCDESGLVSFYDINKEGTENFNIKKIKAHDNAIFDLTWCSADPRRIITVSADKSAIVWDVECSRIISKFLGHSGTIRTVSSSVEDPNIFATGGRDGNVIVWDARNRGNRQEDNAIGYSNIIRYAHSFGNAPISKSLFSVRSITNKNTETASAPVTSVLFHDFRTVISASTKESKIRFWDLRKNYDFRNIIATPARQLEYNSETKNVRTGAGFTHLATDCNRSSLFAPCTDEIVYEYNIIGGNDKPVNTYKGASIKSYYVQCSLPSNLPYLVCGSENGVAPVWRLNKTETPEFYLESADSNEEVTSVAFNDHVQLVTCSDSSWRVWKYEPNVNANRTGVASIKKWEQKEKLKP